MTSHSINVSFLHAVVIPANPPDLNANMGHHENEPFAALQIQRSGSKASWLAKTRYVCHMNFRRFGPVI